MPSGGRSRPSAMVTSTEMTPPSEQQRGSQIDNTPMHPEYPCAHCIVSSAVASAIEAMLGTADISEVAIVSPTAPGVTHRWSNLNAYTDEVAEARICAGFHYRFSTIAGRQMGRDVGTCPWVLNHSAHEHSGSATES